MIRSVGGAATAKFRTSRDDGTQAFNIRRCIFRGLHYLDLLHRNRSDEPPSSLEIPPAGNVHGNVFPGRSTSQHALFESCG